MVSKAADIIYNLEMDVADKQQLKKEFSMLLSFHGFFSTGLFLFWKLGVFVRWLSEQNWLEGSNVQATS